MALRFGWGFFRDLVDWTPATVSTYGNPQVKADFLRLAADAPTTVSPAVTAFAGGGQGSATALTADFSNITTCATAGDSVKLPTAAVGKTFTVTNRGAASADVFPFTGDTINGGSANAAIALPVGATFEFVAINSTDWKTNEVRVATGDGTAALPAHTFSTQPNMGLYKVSSTQLGASVSGALKGGFNATGVFTDVISEQTSTLGVTIDGTLLKDSGIDASGVSSFSHATGVTTDKITERSSGAGITLAHAAIRKNAATAINVTGTITALQLAGGLITSTSAAAVGATLPTATDLGVQLGAARGTIFDFVVDNTAGANTVTVLVGAGIVACAGVVTGSDTLTIAASATQGIGVFRLVFSSATAAVLYRIG